MDFTAKISELLHNGQPAQLPSNESLAATRRSVMKKNCAWTFLLEGRPQPLEPALTPTLALAATDGRLARRPQWGNVRGHNGSAVVKMWSTWPVGIAHGMRTEKFYNHADAADLQAPQIFSGQHAG